ncbi:MAG: M48 family metallopeptidase [bacterium]|nr:M48 family metallopeptidase [bacterium]
MKFKPKQLDEDINVNVSRGSPLKEFFKLLAWVVGSLILLYLLLGLVVTWMAPHISPKVEKAIGRLFANFLCTSENEKKSAELQTIIDEFRPFFTPGDRRLTYRVCVDSGKQVNAIAVPGGMMVVFSGLLDKVEERNEIAFVLAHELGHYHHRHHLKSLGRGLVALVLSIAITGENSSATNFVFNSINQLEMKFSRNQEKAADLYAIDLLKKCYGNIDGALSFMEKMIINETRGKFLYYFASHPHPKYRLEYIKETLPKGYL